jgi:ATP phosphoribosyltransferase regulatory subunit
MSTADTIRASLNRFDPVWVVPPILQPTRFYLEWLGEDLRARAFLTSGEAGDELCLRPDMTTPACRMVLGMPEIPPAVAYEGVVFRRQGSGSARETEFVQLGLECLSTARQNGPAMGEGALMAAALEAVRACGVEPELRLGHAGVFDAFVAALGLHPLWTARLRRQARRVGELQGFGEGPAASTVALTQALAGLPREEAGEALAQLYEATGITAVGSRPTAAIAERLQAKAALAAAPQPKEAELSLLQEVLRVDAPAEAALKALSAFAKSPRIKDQKPVDQALAAVASLWNEMKAEVPAPQTKFSPGFGRTVSIYDGFLFDLEAPALGEQASLGGGGRYNGLIAALARHDGVANDNGIKACGFALRPMRIAQAKERAR